MPQGSADYLYRISLDGSGALSSARAFAASLKQELSKVGVKGAIDLTHVDKQFKNIHASASAAGRSMDMAVGSGAGAKVASTKRGLVGLEAATKDWHSAIARIGVSSEEWLDAGQVNRYMMALQAAQRRVWGIRGMGAQAQMYGREMMGAGVAGLGAAGASAREYAQFAEPLGRAARNLELSSDMTEELDAKMRQLAGTMSVFNPQEQAEGLYLWAAATGEVADSTDELDALMGRVGEVQKLASLGMVSYGQSVEAVTDIQSQYQLGVDDTTNVVATLVKVAATSKAEVGDLAEAFRYAGAYAYQTNTTFEETAAIFQLLSAYGQRGSMAGRGMARLMENLIAPSKQAKAALDEVFDAAFGRTDVLVNAEGKFVGMAQAIRLLADATEELTQAERAEFVAKITTQNAARILLPLLGAEIEARKRGISAIEENKKIITGMADESTTVYQSMMADTMGYVVSTKSATATLTDQWSQFLESVDGRVKMSQANFQSSMVTIGKAVMDHALPAMETLADVLAGVASYAESHPGGVGRTLQALAGLVGAGALVSVLGKGLTLYADYKAIAMAFTFKKAIDQFGVYTTGFALTANQLAAMGPISGAAQGAPIRGGLTGAGAGAAGAGVGAALGIGAIIVAAGYAAAELSSQLLVGRSVLDLMSHDSEAFAAAMEAAAAAAEGMADKTLPEQREYMQKQVEDAEESRDRWLEWQQMQVDQNTKFGTSEERAEWKAGLAQVPDEYRNVLGGIPIQLMQQGVEESEAELTRLKEMLWEVMEAEMGLEAAGADAVLMMRQQQFAAEKAASALSHLPDEWKRPAIQDESAMMSRYTTPSDAWSGFDQEWTGAVEQMRLDKLYELAEVLGLDAEAMTAFIRTMSNAEAAMMGFTGGPVQQSIAMLREWRSQLPTDAELAEGIGSSSQSAWGSLKGMTDIGWSGEKISSAFDEYLSGLEDVYSYVDAEELTREQAELYVLAYNEAFETTLQTSRDTHDEMTRYAEQAAKDQQAAYEKAASGLRSVVEQALTPTKVTAEDVAATEAGDYEEKWDEEVRRMRAAMSGSKKWRDMIPEEVWAQGGESAKAWGNNWIDQFYAGLNPDAINWDVLLDDIEQALAEKAGQRQLVETVMQKLKEERGIDATSEQVLSAMGMTGLISPGMAMTGMMGGMDMEGAGAEAFKEALENTMPVIEEAMSETDMSGPAEVMATAMGSGFKSKIDTYDWGGTVHSSMKSDISTDKENFKGLGKQIGSYMWDGIVLEFEGSKFFWAVVEATVSALNKAAAEQQGGGATGGQQEGP